MIGSCQNYVITGEIPNSLAKNLFSCVSRRILSIKLERSMKQTLTGGSLLPNCQSNFILWRAPVRDSCWAGVTSIWLIDKWQIMKYQIRKFLWVKRRIFSTYTSCCARLHGFPDLSSAPRIIWVSVSYRHGRELPPLIYDLIISLIRFADKIKRIPLLKLCLLWNCQAFGFCYS